MQHKTEQRIKHNQRLLDFLVEEVRLRTYLIVFSFIVLLFGTIYKLLTPYGHGIGLGSNILADATFFDGIYFSVVTISSLGYGDMHPMGFSKALVCIEVILGLAFMGIIIAKVTSRRLSYHVERLFSSDAQKRLEEFSLYFDQSNEALKEIMKDFSKIYQRTPGDLERSLEDIKGRALNRFKELLSTLHIKSVGLSEYLTYETQQGDYFTVAPIDAVRRLANSIEKSLWVLGQLITSLSIDGRTEVFDEHNRQKVSDALNAQRNISGTVEQNSKDSNVKGIFRRILETCDAVHVSYFAGIETETVTEQPNQALKDEA